MTEIINQATEKLSPLKPLTDEQNQLVDQIMGFAKQHIKQDNPAIFTVYGDAGTGKSVVLTHLFNHIQQANRTNENSPFYHA